MKFISFVFILFPLVTHSQLPPSTNWMEFETDHFYVIYDAKQKILAEEYAKQAERAYKTLKTHFQKFPKKTILVINDQYDEANGFATTIFRPMIQVFPVLPSPYDSITHYQDWEFALLIHEFTHVLQMTPAEGFWKPLKFIFGGIIAPNALTPRWYLEGTATSVESSFSDFGRLNSPYYRGLVRSMLEDGTWGTDSIAQINEVGIPTWPFGQRPYFLGSLVTNEIYNQEGTKALDALTLRHAGRVPGFVGGAPVKEYGKSYQDYLSNAYKNWGDVGKEELKKIKAAGQKPAKLIKYNDVDAHFIHSPSISPNGLKLIYIRAHLHSDPHIVLRERKSKNDSFFPDGPVLDSEKPLTTTEGCKRLEWIDNNTILFDSTHTFDRSYTYSDLYRYDIKKEKKKLLTKGKRVRYGVLSPKKTHFVAIQQYAGGNRLVRISLDGKKISTIFDPGLDVRLSTPAFLNSNQIVFAMKGSDGIERLRVYDKRNKKVYLLPGTPAHSQFPRKIPGGIIFTSSSTGVANIYFWNPKTRTSTPLTNVSSFALNAELDQTRNEIIMTRLRGNGFQLEILKNGKKKAYPPKLARKKVVKYEIKEAPKESLTLNEESYWGTSYLFPQYWLPSINFTGSGKNDDEVGVFLGATTGASDPVGHHAYDIGGGYDTLTEQPSGYFTYMNSWTPIRFGALLSETNDYLYGAETYQRNSIAQGIFSFYLPWLSNNWRGNLGWNYHQSEVDDLGLQVLQGPSIGFQYMNLEQSGYQISPENGGRLYADYTKYMDDFGDLEIDQFIFGGATFINWLLPKHHVIFLRTDHTITPDNRNLLLGTTVAGGEFSGFSSGAAHIIRGYPVGEFVAWSASSVNFEYRFPIARIYEGTRTGPLFFKSIHMAVVADAIQIDGGYYKYDPDADEDSDDPDELVSVDKSTTFGSVGVEGRVDTSLMYNLPATIRVGLYYGFDADAYGGLYPFVGIGTLF